MRISELAVKNPQFTIVASLMLVALAGTAFVAIPRSEDPHFPLPFVTVTTVFPGASALDLEQTVAQPLEDAIRELDALEHVRSTLRDGVSVTRIEFESDADTEAKYQEVLREVDRLRPTLPREIERLDVVQSRTTAVNVMEFALASDEHSYDELAELGDVLEARIERVPGVRGAEVVGAPERQVRVELDLPRLAQLGVPASRVLAALGSDNVNVPGGAIDAGGRRFDVTTNARYRTLDDVRRTLVAAGVDGAVHLADVATVSWGYEAHEHRTRWNGKRAILVTVQFKEAENVFTVRDGVVAALGPFERALPRGIELARGFDQSRNVDERFGRLYGDFAIAILLVLITLLPLGFRASGLVMLSIPLSLATGILLLHLFGYGLNQLSIVGFVIALGLVVDDSIVVVENITRFLREGHGRVEAAIEACKQIGVAVLGCTATLILAFVPLLFLPGGSGNFIRSLPMAVVAAVVGSLLVSLTIVPCLASRMLPLGADVHGNVFLRAMERFIERGYSKVLERAIARPKRTVALAGVLFVSSLGLVSEVGFSLFPEAGIPQVRITIEAPEGASLETTDRAARFAESVLRRHSEVSGFFTNVGRGNPQIYYNVHQHPPDEEFAELFVQLREYDPRVTPAFFDRLRRELAAYSSAEIRVKAFQNGPPLEAPIAVRVYGEDLDQLRGLAAEVEDVVRSIPGTRDVENPIRQGSTDLRLLVDRDRAGMLGVATADVVRTVRLGVAGLTVGSLQEASGEAFDIRVRLANPERPTLDALSRIYVDSASGAAVPLAQVATTPFDTAPTVMQRLDGERVVTITADLRTGENTERVTRAVLERIRALRFPRGTRFEAGGERESRAESFDGLGLAVVFAVFGILAVLVLEFRTFKSTLVVATVIPLGFVGGIVFLYAFGYSLSFTASIGFIALTGIEIKNSILLVDFTNQLRSEGMTLDEAIRKAGEIRFLPIVLTTLTALGGLLPLALEGSPLYSPLAVVIVGGLVTSTLFARLVTPAAYKWLAPELAGAE